MLRGPQVTAIGMNGLTPPLLPLLSRTFLPTLSFALLLLCLDAIGQRRMLPLERK